jgi:hypothetical protein
MFYINLPSQSKKKCYESQPWIKNSCRHHPDKITASFEREIWLEKHTNIKN